MKTCHEQFIYSTGRHYPFRLGVKFNDNEEISGTGANTNDKTLLPGGILGQAHHMFSRFMNRRIFFVLFFYKVPSLNTQFCIKGLLVVLFLGCLGSWACTEKKIGPIMNHF